MKRTDDRTLIKAMRILSMDIESEDGVANATIAEAANRLEELHEINRTLSEAIEAHLDKQDRMGGE